MKTGTGIKIASITIGCFLIGVGIYSLITLPEHKKLATMVKELEEAAVSCDRSAMERILASEIYRDGLGRSAHLTRDEFIENTCKSHLGVASVKVEPLNIDTVESGAAVEVATYVTRIVDGRESTESFADMHYFEKERGEWRIRAVVERKPEKDSEFAYLIKRVVALGP